MRKYAGSQLLLIESLNAGRCSTFQQMHTRLWEGRHSAGPPNDGISCVSACCACGYRMVHGGLATLSAPRGQVQL